MENYNLPELPEGYRWYIKKSFGSPYLCLQKKGRLFGWYSVADSYIVLWHRGDYASRVRQTAYEIMQKEEAKRIRLHLGEVK